MLTIKYLFKWLAFVLLATPLYIYATGFSFNMAFFNGTSYSLTLTEGDCINFTGHCQQQVNIIPYGHSQNIFMQSKENTASSRWKLLIKDNRGRILCDNDMTLSAETYRNRYRVNRTFSIPRCPSLQGFISYYVEGNGHYRTDIHIEYNP